MQVADCVSLMSLDKLDAVPVDTHVWQIAKRDYGFSSGNGQKTLTDKVHREIGECDARFASFVIVCVWLVVRMNF